VRDGNQVDGGVFGSPLLDTTENGWDALRAAPGDGAYATAKAPSSTTPRRPLRSCRHKTSG